jgi:hypothetical protein
MSSPSSPSDGARLVPLVALIAVVLTVVLTAFAWPAVRSAPRDVPIAVAGPSAATAQVTDTLEARAPGAFDVRLLDDEAAAHAAIEDRQVYGAVVVGESGPSVLVASAASPAVAQALREVATGLGAAAGTQVAVEDVVPLSADDPRGAGLAAAALPLAIGGVLTAGLVSRLVRRAGVRALAALAMATVGGMVTATILGTWLGALQSGWWVTTGVVAFGMAAIALVLLGLHSLAREAGLALGAATVILLGNPLSGLASAPELLPSGWGTLGQLLPPGATGSLLRSVSWFDGAGAAAPLWVLTAWSATGLALLAIGALVARRRQPAAESARVPVPA